MKPPKRWIPPSDEVMRQIFPKWGKRREKPVVQLTDEEKRVLSALCPYQLERGGNLKIQ